MCLLCSQANAHTGAGNVDPIKLAKRLAGWVVTAQKYAQAMNMVLTTAVHERSFAFEKMMTSLKPPKTVAGHMNLSDYLDGTLVVWRKKENIFSPTKDEQHCLTCVCCGTSHRFSRIDRVLMHLMSKKHHAKCKEQLEAAAKTRSQNLLNDHCKVAASKWLVGGC